MNGGEFYAQATQPYVVVCRRCDFPSEELLHANCSVTERFCHLSARLAIVFFWWFSNGLTLASGLASSYSPVQFFKILSNRRAFSKTGQVLTLASVVQYPRHNFNACEGVQVPKQQG